MPDETPATPRFERLGEYRLVREVGRGAMGVVYEAVHEPLRRRVALKVLPRCEVLSCEVLSGEVLSGEVRSCTGVHGGGGGLK